MFQHVFYSQQSRIFLHHVASRQDSGFLLKLCLCLLLISPIATISVSAAPNVTVITEEAADTNGSGDNTANQGVDKNSNEETTKLDTTSNTLANQQPSQSKLSAANQTLLTQNAKLQREVNDLQTQVNVLIHERSGQIYLYGVFTVIVSLLVGFGLGMFVFHQRDRW